MKGLAREREFVYVPYQGYSVVRRLARNARVDCEWGALASAQPSADVTPYAGCNDSAGAVKRTVTSSLHKWVAYSPTDHSINNTSTTVKAVFTAASGGSRSASVWGTVSGGIDAAIATAQASVSSEIVKTVSWNTTLSDEVTVPAHKTGYGQVGSDAYTVNIRTQKLLANDTWQVQGDAKLTAPTTVGWKLWIQ